MHISSLELTNYRNYTQATVEFGQGVNIIYGDNAQGKTNLIEAIYLCATSKSHRLSFDRELIRIGEDEAHVYMEFYRGDIHENIDIHLKKKGKKGVAVNKMPVKKLSELFGLIHVIMFSPEDLGLIKNGPKDRRRFIDMELSQLNPVYMHYLAGYHKVLKQRNGLLKKGTELEDIDGLLDVFDLQLIEYGSKVIEFRQNFIEDLKPVFHGKHRHLSGEKEVIELIYENNIDIDLYEEKLRSRRKVDMIRGTTSVGPHRDDLRFDINGIDIRKFGSQGQQRTAALSLKLSEIDLVRKEIDDEPILLLDDVLSELDHNRQRYLIEHLENVQTFITCTGVEDFIKNEMDQYRMYHIDEATITRT